jgi:hypothetical protein
MNRLLEMSIGQVQAAIYNMVEREKEVSVDMEVARSTYVY